MRLQCDYFYNGTPIKPRFCCNCHAVNEAAMITTRAAVAQKKQIFLLSDKRHALQLQHDLLRQNRGVIRVPLRSTGITNLILNRGRNRGNSACYQV